MSLKKILPLVIIGAAPVSQLSFADVYELRTYTTYDGCLDALLARFRDHARIKVSYS